MPFSRAADRQGAVRSRCGAPAKAGAVLRRGRADDTRTADGVEMRELRVQVRVAHGLGKALVRTVAARRRVAIRVPEAIDRRLHAFHHLAKGGEAAGVEA